MAAVPGFRPRKWKQKKHQTGDNSRRQLLVVNFNHPNVQLHKQLVESHAVFRSQAMCKAQVTVVGVVADT